jgi:hypothetical protein
MRVRIILAAALLVATAACSSSSSKSAAKTTTSSASAGPKTTQTDALFVVNGKAGTATAPTNGSFPLVITGVNHDAVFFTDRPVHDSGLVGVDRMLDMLAKGHEGPPNGAVEVQNGAQGPVVAAVELTSPQYDPAAGTLTAQARILPKTLGPHLHHYDTRLASQLPASFTNAALFIDNAITTVSKPSTAPSTAPNSTPTSQAKPGSAPFGSTNFCAAQVTASTGPVTLTGQSDWSTDTWDPAPPSNGTKLLNGGNSSASASWQSDGGFARGCGNSTTWQTWDGVTFQTSITDPYSGSNSISCTSTDTVMHPCHIGTNSTTTGDAITLYFYFCDLKDVPNCPGL